MDNPLPNSNIDIFKLASKIEKIAQEEGFKAADLTKILVALPIGDSENMTYLEDAGKCILDTSNLVDEAYLGLPQNQKTAKKFKLMGKLLLLKAEVLV
jgi:hypothetical protein